MPPRKAKAPTASKATQSRKRKAAGDATPSTTKKPRKNAAAKKPEPEPKPKPKRPKVPNSSKAARRRNTFQLTRESLIYDEDADEDLSLFETPFGDNSPSNQTWGTSALAAIPAVRKRRRAPAFSKLALPRGLGMFLGDGSLESIVPNDSERSPILRLSLEVREVIYSYLLLSPRAILVKPDWVTIETSQLRNHALIFVCKQLSHESTSFIYRHNTFHTVLRSSTRRGVGFNDPVRIDTSFLPLYKNIVIECPKTSWDLSWFEKAIRCIRRLGEAGTVLQSLTLVVSPQRVGMTETALGRERAPITFADFLWTEGGLMRAVLAVACHKVKVVVKVDGVKEALETGTWSLERAKWRTMDRLARRQRGERAKEVMEELKDWKTRLEKVFEENEDRMAANAAERKARLRADDNDAGGGDASRGSEVIILDDSDDEETSVKDPSKPVEVVEGKNQESMDVEEDQEQLADKVPRNIIIIDDSDDDEGEPETSKISTPESFDLSTELERFDGATFMGDTMYGKSSPNTAFHNLPTDTELASTAPTKQSYTILSGQVVQLKRPSLRFIWGQAAQKFGEFDGAFANVVFWGLWSME